MASGLIYILLMQEDVLFISCKGDNLLKGVYDNVIVILKAHSHS
jgi:hypothetical protein